MDTNKQLTLDQVQVNVTNLTTEQIKEMVDIYLEEGFELADLPNVLKISVYWSKMRLRPDSSLGIFSNNMKPNLIEITYEEFIKTFSKKSKTGWYKEQTPSIKKWLCFRDLEKDIRYGFNNNGGFFKDSNKVDYICKSEYSAEQEFVEQRLISYAKSIGFVDNIEFKAMDGSCRVVIDECIFSFKDNILYVGVFPIMQDGVWAEIVKHAVEKDDVTVKDLIQRTEELLEEYKQRGLTLYVSNNKFNISKYE